MSEVLPATIVVDVVLGTEGVAQIEPASPGGFGNLFNWATCGSEAATVVDAVDGEGGNRWGRPVMP